MFGWLASLMDRRSAKTIYDSVSVSETLPVIYPASRRSNMKRDISTDVDLR